MLSIGAATKVYLRAGPTDLRQGFEGLYQVVRGVMGHDPQSGSVFAFATGAGLGSSSWYGMAMASGCVRSASSRGHLPGPAMDR